MEHVLYLGALHGLFYRSVAPVSNKEMWLLPLSYRIQGNLGVQVLKVI